MPKPKRRRVVPQPAMSSEDYANWEGAPVTAQVARNEENHVLNKTHEMTTENKVCLFVMHYRLIYNVYLYDTRISYT